MLTFKQIFYEVISIKKITLCLISVLICSTLVFSGCVEQQQEGIQIVASFYPLAFFAKEIGGEYVNVRQLISDNTELHAWQPTPQDIIAADNADILVYNGANLDRWFEENILTSIDTADKLIVKTTQDISLLEQKTDEVTRLFIFDNTNKNTLVYDVDSHGNAALHKTLNGIAVDVLPQFGGYFDTPPLVETHHGYWYIFAPRLNSVEVINTGIHGDHFHDAEVLLSIPSGKPVHSAVSPDKQWVAFAEDADKKTLVIPVSAPAQYRKYDDAGTSGDNHATISFDEHGLLFSADMRTPSAENLVIQYVENGTIYRTGDGGTSPHGAVYSSETGYTYINCADGITIISKEGNHGNFSYTHEANNGYRLVRSWIAENQPPYYASLWLPSLVSYVRNLAHGLEYDSLVVYDIITKELTKEIPLNITAVNLQDYGYANSEFSASKSLALFADPQNGQVHIVDIVFGQKHSIQLPGEFPQSMRITIDPVTEDAWVVTHDSNVYKICLDDLEIEDTYQLESELGVHFVIAAITPRQSHHEHDHETEHLLEDIEHIIHEWEDGDITLEEALEEIEQLIHSFHHSSHIIEEIDHIIHEWEDGEITAQQAMHAIEEIIHHAGDHHHDHDHHHHELYDPHTWISPFIAKQQAQAIYNALVEVDPENEQYYTNNWNQLQQKFMDFDTAYSEQLALKQKDEIIVTHSAFGYLAQRYHFNQKGVIGISADEQPSASTLAALINTMIANNNYVIYIDPVYSDSYAQTLKNTLESKTGHDVQILTLYLMSGEFNGLDYFQQMQQNLENLKIGLQAS